MKNLATAAVLSSVMMASNVVQANSAENLGVGVNYGLISGPALELSYPINDLLQVRGSLSSGMDINETANETDIEYDVESDGGIHRLALDYHPFSSGFFLSAGYAVNDFKLKATGTSSLVGDTVQIGDTDYTIESALSLKGKLDWDNAPTLSMGWGHSPARGWGAMIEVGAIFTGSPDVSLSGTGTVNDGSGSQDVSSDPAVQDALRKEEQEIKDEVADFNFLPILQAGVTYRF